MRLLSYDKSKIILKRKIRIGFLLSIIGCGYLQFILLPGLLWNLIFPLFVFFSIAYFILVKKKGNSIHKFYVWSIALLFLFEIGLRFYSKSNAKKPILSTRIKVMTYNVFFKNKSPNNTIRLILKENPDILFIQELTPKWAAILNKKLGNTYPYKLLKPLDGTHGIGIYSKHQLSNHQLLNNSYNKPYAQIADLRIGQNKVQLLNSHLASPAVAIENRDEFFSLYCQNYKTRKNQLQTLTAIAKKNTKKFQAQLIVGDLNTMKYEPIFKSLKFSWVDSHSVSGKGLGFNFPHSSRIAPILTLDYILGKGQIKFIETNVIEGGGSDHLAIVSTMEI